VTALRIPLFLAFLVLHGEGTRRLRALLADRAVS
jgi:hypothetical protein